MDFDTASRAAHAWFDEVERARNAGLKGSTPYTVRDAIDAYVEHVRANKGEKAANLVPGRLTNRLRDAMLDKPVATLTTHSGFHRFQCHRQQATVDIFCISFFYDSLE
jgi:hypothetical protein